MSELPTAQDVLAVLVAEHSPFDTAAVTGRGTVRCCRACSATSGRVSVWPCRVHQVAAQPTQELERRGLRTYPLPSYAKETS